MEKRHKEPNVLEEVESERYVQELLRSKAVDKQLGQSALKGEIKPVTPYTEVPTG